MIKAVIFDLGGTLVKSEDAYMAALFDTFDHYHIPKPERSDIIKYVGISDKHFIYNCMPKKYRTSDNLEKCEMMFNNIFPMNYLDRFVEIEGTQETLEYLCARDIKIAIATGWERWKADMILSLYEWRKFIDVLVTLEDFKKTRPASDIVRIAVKKLGVKRNECLYVDDTLNGVKAGKSAKVKTVIVLTGAQSEEIRDNLKIEEETDFMIESVKLLKYIIE